MSHPILWHIVGAGAIGQYFAAELSKQVHVCLHAKQHTINQIELTDLNKHIQTIDLEQDDQNPIQYLIICTKAYDAVQAFETYRSRLTEHCQIVCLFNGLGPQFEIQTQHTAPVWLASTTVGARKISSNHVLHTGQGITIFGQTTQIPKPSNIINTLEKMHWCHSTNILHVLYLKLAINSLINPLTVIFNCNNGKLLNIKKATNIMMALALEIESICKKVNIELSSAFILQNTYQVIEKTAQNYSSMHQDVANKRRTEIQLINGYWQNLGQTHNINVEQNTLMMDKIMSFTVK
ncbi:ketopantoate reductase family protein [Marinicellulosiphila megalodicopiae]|uniref:ketopantoate reductase family protein n=1 Tax=Marinicellulosiphila megalodicopiae TaxID=2724896 RepID=UPI003BAEA6C7